MVGLFLQVILTELGPWLILSLSRNVRKEAAAAMLYHIVNIFTVLARGRFSLVVAMSVCLRVCPQSTNSLLRPNG